MIRLNNKELKEVLKDIEEYLSESINRDIEFVTHDFIYTLQSINFIVIRLSNDKEYAKPHIYLNVPVTMLKLYYQQYITNERNPSIEICAELFDTVDNIKNALKEQLFRNKMGEM